MLRLDIPVSVARECIEPLTAAAARAEGSAELARTNESFERFEREAVAIDCLLHALNAAIRADAADRSPMPPADCDPVTGQEYGTGA